MITTAKIRSFIKRNEFWSEEDAEKFILNCSCPWSTPEPDEREPGSGVLCELWAEHGLVQWTWRWDNGYDEHYTFGSLRTFGRFFRALINEGIDGIELHQYGIVVD